MESRRLSGFAIISFLFLILISSCSPSGPNLEDTVDLTITTRSSNVSTMSILPEEDAITPEITQKVCSWCVNNNISVSNLCFGIGAYTYQYVTRDTRGYAIKATDCILGDDEIQIYKMPKTDPGKKSPRGCVAVIKVYNGNYWLVENLTLEEAIEYKNNVMRFKVKNGKFCSDSVETIETIRERLMGEKFCD